MANCIKCGKELVGTKVFCSECQAVMDKHPVPSGTPLIIHQRVNTASKKSAAKKKVISPEEQVVRLRKVIHWLIAIVLVLLLLLGVAACWLAMEIQEPDVVPVETMVQNQSSVTPNPN